MRVRLLLSFTYVNPSITFVNVQSVFTCVNLSSTIPVMGDEQHQKSRQELRRLRGPLNSLIAQAMRRDGIKEVARWADHWGIGRTTLYSLLRGRETSSGKWMRPSLETLTILARALDQPLHTLVYLVEPDAYGASLIQTTPPPPTVREIDVRVAGWVGAGPDQDEWDTSTVCVEESFARGKDLIAFRIRGDSMAAGRQPIYDGDIVIVNRRDKGANTSTVVARLASDGYVCKVLKDDRFGRLLQSRNVDHTNGTPTAIPMSDVEEIVGRVVRIVSDVAV